MRRDIQALRGFSIVVVLLYHAQFGWLRGGFLGVDIFFVISGFVITSKLMEGDGSFASQIKDFYLRRAKRILPASLTVTVLTAIFANFYLPAISRSRFSIDALASALFSANLNFARIGNDYLAQSADPSPFLHYWSLGVEEQFYLLWPILFILLYKARKNLVLPTLLGTAVIGIWFTSINPVASFYLPFSRFWEFFAGIFLAINLRLKAPRAIALPVAILGWAALVFSVLWVTTSDATPGFTTCFAIIGAGLVLYANVDFKQIFILPFLGDYSFSLYLVHWPVVVYFLDRNSKLTSMNKLLIVLIALFLSFALTHLVERPARFQKRFRLSLPQWGAIVLVGSLMSFGTLSIGSASTSKVTIDKSVPATYNDGCHLSFGVTWPLHECAYGDTASSTEIILAGDSHAAQWFPALEKIAIGRHWKLLNLTKSSCPATILETMRNGKFDSSCAIWQIKVLNKIALDKPAFVILSDFTEYQYPLNQSSSHYVSTWTTGLSKFLTSIHYPVIFLGDTPKPTSALSAFPFNRSQATTETKNAVIAAGGKYVDTASWLCAKKCETSFQGFNTYRDNSHISVATAKALTTRLSAAIPSR